ncbi:MAG: methyltransferase domain-containing protein [Deltaproteobacteria bacterium]|nr:methyltransferase domain-containing protein [Deltaproteobacteria bacterium]
MNMDLNHNETIDCFMNGRLSLIQSKDGYRFSVDAVLLSKFVGVKKGDIVLDLGTGCGVIPLILLLTSEISYAVGIEIQEELASQARRNAILNGFANKMDIILGDIRSCPITKSSVDVVVCNPPYRKIKSGRINPDTRRAIARHEILVSLDDILIAAKYSLCKKGRLAMVYPSVRAVDMFVRMRHFGFEPKRVQIIYPDIKTEASMVLVEAIAGGRGGLKVEPPVFGQGNFSIR